MKNVNPQAATAVTTPTPPLHITEESPTLTKDEILADHIKRFSTDMYQSDYLEALTDGFDLFCERFFCEGMVMTAQNLDIFNSRLFVHHNLCNLVVRLNDYREK